MTASERLAAIAKAVQYEAIKHGDIALETPVENVARITGYYGSSIALQAMARILRETARDMKAEESSTEKPNANATI